MKLRAGWRWALGLLAGCRSCGDTLVSDQATREQPVPASLFNVQSLGEREISPTKPWDVDGRQRLSVGTDFTPERVGTAEGTVDWYLYGTQSNPGDARYPNGLSRLWYISRTSEAGTGGRAGVYRWVCTAIRFEPSGPFVTIAVQRLPDEAANPVLREGPIPTGKVVTRWLSTAGTKEIHFAEGPGQRGSVVVDLSVGRNHGPQPDRPWSAMLSVRLGISGIGPEGNASLQTFNPAGPEFQPRMRAMDARVEVLRTEFSRDARFRPGTDLIEGSGPMVDMHVLVAIARQ